MKVILLLKKKGIWYSSLLKRISDVDSLLVLLVAIQALRIIWCGYYC